MISRATMNLKPAVIELDFGPSSKRPFWIRSGCVCGALAHVRFGSKADMCSALAHVRFTPNSDRKSRHAQMVMSALPLKADMCGATRDVRFGPIADIAAGVGSVVADTNDSAGCGATGSLAEGAS